MQKGYGRWILLSFLVVGLLAACAGGISREARSQVTYMGTFAEVQQSPSKYEGQTVLWTGKVIASQVKNGATELTVLQLDSGSQDRPSETEQSHGRFLIRSAQFLDPALYPQGTPITVVGRLQGSETRPIGEMPYTYPVVDPIEIKKWPVAHDSEPRFRFGIGIGTHF